MSITPSIYTVISKSNPTGVYSRLPNSYITNLVYTPSVRPLNPSKGEQYYDESDNILYYWDGSNWVSGNSLPPGVYYGDYLYWNGTGGYVVGSNKVTLGAISGQQDQGNYSVAVGYSAGRINQGEYSIAIGHNAGSQNQATGLGTSIAIGRNAGYNIQRDFSVAIGNNAGFLEQGEYSVALGRNTGFELQNDYSVAIGNIAGFTRQGTESVAIGNNAGNYNQGNYSVGIGRNTAFSSQGYDSVAIGSYAGNTSQGNTSIALGYYAGYNQQSDYSIGIGNGAGFNQQRSYSVAIGNNAGRETQQFSAIAIGDNAGYNNQQDNCIAIGSLAGNNNQGVTADPTNGQAIAIGYRAAEDSQGDQAIAIGTRSGNVNQHDYGIAIGHYAGSTEQSTGAVAIGVNAGSYQQGEYSIALGYNAGSNSQVSRSIIINASPTGLDSNTGGLFINPIRGGISSQVLFYNPSSNEITYSTGGLQGPQGPDGTNGISGGLTLFLDTNGSSAGSLLTIPNQTTGTMISSGNQSNSIIKIATFITPTGTLQSNIILGGLWDMNLYASSANSYYWFSVSYVDQDGVSNKVNIATGSSLDATQISTDISPYVNSIYIPTTTLPNVTKRILVDVFLQTIGTNINTNLYFRNSTLSHVHTSLLTVSQGISNIGKDTQVLFNYQGSTTGSNNLTYTGGNLILSTGNIGIGTTNPSAPLHVATNLTTLPTTALIVNNYSGQNLSGNDYTLSQLLMGTLSYYAGIQLRIPTGSYGDVTRLDFTTPAASNSNVQATRMSIMPTSGNVGIGTTNPTYLLHVNGNISPYTINRGNPGRNNTLLLDSFNTTHFYSINASTGFIDISTQMVENAVYEVCFNLSSSSTNNNDMIFYPNSTTNFGGSTFYTAYQQTSTTPSLQYNTTVASYFMFDMVNGGLGWDPVGKITIYNNRSCKKIVFTGGDTTAPVHGQGYWTNNTGFTSTSGTAPVYDTTTVWSTVGRLQFGSPLFSNWNVWVKRIM